LFNLDLSSGAYSCARCHTPGWSWGDPGVPGQGALGWNLTDGAPARHFPSENEMIDFIKNGSELGARYGTQGQGSGRMPGFGHMLTDEQIEAIVEYVRSL
jgi:mono/diheme cytochrome c family protein